MKNVVVFGASGDIGLFVLSAALKTGFKVRAFVRDANKIPDGIRSQVEVVVGNVTQPEDVQKGVANQDAVIVTLGTRNDLSATTVLSDGMKNILTAMKAAGIQIVSVCLSAFLFFEPTKIPSQFKDLNADHQRMFDCLKASELKWIAVLPGHFTNESSGDFTIKHDASPGRTIAKPDLASFLVDSLSQPEHYNQVCGIASVPKSTPVSVADGEAETAPSPVT